MAISTSAQAMPIVPRGISTNTSAVTTVNTHAASPCPSPTTVTTWVRDDASSFPASPAYAASIVAATMMAIPNVATSR